MKERVNIGLENQHSYYHQVTFKLLPLHFVLSEYQYLVLRLSTVFLLYLLLPHALDI